MIEDVINRNWLWVTSQRNGERGLVHRSYVDDAVGTCSYWAKKFQGFRFFDPT